LYATPNAASFDLLTAYPQYSFDPREDPRIYADEAVLKRCEYQHDLGPKVTALYLDTWTRIKFG